MEISTIHHIALTVTDLEKSKKFYREILSIKEIPPTGKRELKAFYQWWRGRQEHRFRRSSLSRCLSATEPRALGSGLRRSRR